ncbi:MAG: DUF2723 domain-containing protein [Anaerolineae bacterium]|nr:DUF2723 domain-containing protein [Anaerolineae bacterium]
MTPNAGAGRQRPVALAQWAAGALVLAALLTLYLFTLDDGLRMEELQGGDLITHQYAQVEGRFSNAPGYPLYTLGGWLWFRMGRLLLSWALSPIQILSLYSTLWALAALATMYVLALELSPGRWPLAAAVTLFYGVTYFFWYYSVSTEQYTSAVFQTLLLALLALRWERTQRDRLLRWIAFVVGTCAANLVTTLLLVPPLAWFILSRRPDLLRRRRLIASLAALAALPILSYAFVYLRGAQHPEWRGEGDWPHALAWFLDFISTSQGREEMTLSLLPLGLSYLCLVPAELTWPVLVAGLAGLGLLGRRRAVLLLGTVLLYLLFSYVDRFGNWYQVVMPAYPLVILGLVGLSRCPRARADGPWSRLVLAGIVILLLLGTGDRLATNLPRANLSQRLDDDALCPGRAILADLQLLDPDGIASVLVTYEESLSLQYLQSVLGEGDRVRVLTDPAAVESATHVSRHAAPLALPSPGWRQPHAAGEVLLAPEAPEALRLAAVTSARAASLGPLSPSQLALDLRDRSPACGGPALLVLIRWHLLEPLDADLSISVRALSQGALIRADQGPAQDDHPPVWGLSPTSTWSPGDERLDAYLLPLSEERAADSLELVAYVLTDDGPETLWEAELPLPE